VSAGSTHAAREAHEGCQSCPGHYKAGETKPGQQKEATEDRKGRQRTLDQSSEHEPHHIQEYGVWAYNTGIKHSVSPKKKGEKTGKKGNKPGKKNLVKNKKVTRMVWA
jgi:hypothetical protein